MQNSGFGRKVNDEATCRITVHPRICGEHPTQVGSDYRFGGSSPRLLGTPVDLGHALNLTPRRAVQYFESKGYDTSTWTCWDTWQDAHGHYHRHLANVESRPYWKYVAVRDEHTRPEHAALDGAVFRWDDPFWDTHYPPNGFNCRCRVIALTAAEVKSMNLTVSRSKGNLTVIEQEVGTDKRSGEVIIRPATSYSFTGKDGKRHVLTPDPGWNYNPGKAQTLYDLERGPSGGALPALADKQPTWRDFSLPRITDTPAPLRLPTPALLPKADNATAALAQLEGALAVPNTGVLLVRTPDGLDDVVVRREYLPHIVEKRAHARERYANWILPTLQSPLEVWLARHEDEVYRRRFIAAFGTHDNQSLVIAQENRDGSLLWTFFPTKDNKYLDRQRSGHLLYRRSQ